MAARSEPQIPLSVGITRTQLRAGSSGSATSPRCSIESALVATSGRPPDALTMANLGMLLSKVSASTDPPTRASPDLPGERGGDPPTRASPDLPGERGGDPPTRASHDLPGERGGDLSSPSHGLPVFRRARVRHRKPPVSRRHLPALHPPPALSGHLRQPRVRVHCDRRADELEHPEVRQRVGVSEALRQNDPVARRVLLEQRSARL